MLIYLVTGTVEKTLYMEDIPECKKEMRIVLAENVKEAKDKFEKYFMSMCSDYDVYYSVYNIDVIEPIM